MLQSLLLSTLPLSLSKTRNLVLLTLRIRRTVAPRCIIYGVTISVRWIGGDGRSSRLLLDFTLTAPFILLNFQLLPLLLLLFGLLLKLLKRVVGRFLEVRIQGIRLIAGQQMIENRSADAGIYHRVVSLQ